MANGDNFNEQCLPLYSLVFLINNGLCPLFLPQIGLCGLTVLQPPFKLTLWNKA